MLSLNPKNSAGKKLPDLKSHPKLLVNSDDPISLIRAVEKAWPEPFEGFVLS